MRLIFMPFLIEQGNIVDYDVDCIVNAANRELLMGGGVCGAIFKAAGYTKLQNECDKLSPIETGDAVITKGYDLKAKYIIHTAGPIYIDGRHNENELLSSCYYESLKLASENNITSIAFPFLSSGIYGYPKQEAYQVAKETILSFLKEHIDMTVILVFFDFVPKTKLNPNISIIDDSYDESTFMPSMVTNARQLLICKKINIPKTNKGFYETLCEYIDKANIKDSEFYMKANIDRRLYSKFKRKDYKPSKNTAISCALALQLNLNETNALLETLGYVLSKSIYFDQIIEYCINNKMYDIYEVNEILFSENQPCLGNIKD